MDDIAAGNAVIIEDLLSVLLSEVPRVTLADKPPVDTAGSHHRFNGVVSPGWC